MKEKVKPGYDRLIENVIGLAETYIKLLQLEFKLGFTNATALLLVIFGLIGILSFGVVFLSIGFAFYLNHYFSFNTHTGFFIVSVIYFILLPLLVMSRKFLRSVIFKMVSSFSKNS